MSSSPLLLPYRAPLSTLNRVFFSSEVQMLLERTLQDLKNTAQLNSPDLTTLHHFTFGSGTLLKQVLCGDISNSIQLEFLDNSISRSSQRRRGGRAGRGGYGPPGDDNKKMTTVLTTYDDEATALFSLLSPFPCFLFDMRDPLGSGCADSRPDDFVRKRAPQCHSLCLCNM